MQIFLAALLLAGRHDPIFDGLCLEGMIISMSYADQVFIDNCKDILTNGVWDTGLDVRPRWEDGSPAHTVKRFGLINRYDLRREFPAMTLRRLAFKSCVDEMLWIWQKKSNRVAELNSRVWDAWADETGTIGKAYGYQLGVRHVYPEGEMDQVDRMLYDLKHNPQSRRILCHLYNHADLHAMGLYPCAWSLTLNVSGSTLNAILNQRSQDMLTANNWNVCQYAVLVHMLAQVSGLEAGEFVHVIADAHIYDRHVPLVEAMLAKKPLPAPALRLDPSVRDFYAFTPAGVSLEGYRHHDLGAAIPVAV
jgi:thymidylate synthase